MQTPQKIIGINLLFSSIIFVSCENVFYILWSINYIKNIFFKI